MLTTNIQKCQRPTRLPGTPETDALSIILSRRAACTLADAWQGCLPASPAISLLYTGDNGERYYSQDIPLQLRRDMLLLSPLAGRVSYREADIDAISVKFQLIDEYRHPFPLARMRRVLAMPENG